MARRRKPEYGPLLMVQFPNCFLESMRGMANRRKLLPQGRGHSRLNFYCKKLRAGNQKALRKKVKILGNEDMGVSALPTVEISI